MTRADYIAFGIIFLFALCLNIFFPPQSDDIDAIVSGKFGISSIITSYFTWNARFGELLFVGFLAQLHPNLFDILNALCWVAFIYLFFVALFARSPHNDAFLIALIMLLLLAFAPIGASFLWGAGSANYLWGISILMLGFIPYRIFWQRVVCGDSANLTLESWRIVAFGALSFCAGMTSEQCGILLIIAHFIAIIYAKSHAVRLPKWYIVGIVCFVGGFLALYLAPGPMARSGIDMRFITLGEFFALDINDKIARISRAVQDSQLRIFQLFTLILIIATYFTHKRAKIPCVAALCALIIYDGVALLWHIAATIMLAMLWREKWARCVAALYAAYAFTCVAGLQVIALPFRARVGDIMLLVAAICIIYWQFRGIFTRKIRALIISVAVGFGAFVIGEYAQFYANWLNTLDFIEAQKARGEADIVIPNIFKSRYENYYGWFMPTDIAVESPNPHYAKYFNVRSFRVDKYWDD